LGFLEVLGVIAPQLRYRLFLMRAKTWLHLQFNFIDYDYDCDCNHVWSK